MSPRKILNLCIALCVELGLASVALLATGCAQDHTLDAYREQQVSKDLAAIDAVAGTYRGTLFSKADGSPLGAITLVIRSATSVGQSSDGLTSERHATLQALLTYQDSTQPAIGFTQGAFLESSNTFQASTSTSTQLGVAGIGGVSSGSATGVGGASVSVATIQIEGAFSGGTVTGSVESADYPDTGATFKAQRDASLPNIAAANRWKRLGMEGSDSKEAISIYRSGKVTDSATPAPFTMRLDVIAPVVDQKQKFIDLLTPTKNLSINLWMDEGVAQIAFNNAIFDYRTGTLRGVGSVFQNGQGTYANIECSQETQNGAQGWSCSYYSIQAASGWVFRNVFFAPDTTPPAVTPAPTASPVPNEARP